MILVDASMLFHRNLHGMPDLKASTGIPTGMEYGNLRCLEMLQKRFRGHDVCLCYDSPGCWRKKADARYKSNRGSLNGDERTQFFSRVKGLRKVCDAAYAHSEMDGQEADDLLFTLAIRLGKANPAEKVYVYTNDADLLQAVRENVIVLKSHESAIFEWDIAKVEDKYRVRPEALPALRALVGDSSDALEGVKRVDKEILADCVREAWRNHLEHGLPPTECLVMTAEDFQKRGRWTDREWERLSAFIYGGQGFELNFRLMALSEVQGVTITPPNGDTESARQMLEQWEIRALSMCRVLGVGAAAAAAEEF